MKISEETGLPEVPEGYFWRVKYYTLCSDEISLRKKRKFWVSKKVASNLVITPITDDYVRDVADRIYRRVFEYKNRSSRYGDYPPKSLNG